MTKSELITTLVHQSHLGHRDVELAVSTLLDHMSQTLAHGGRIEIRGFGSFSLNYHPPRTGRNPSRYTSTATATGTILFLDHTR